MSTTNPSSDAPTADGRWAGLRARFGSRGAGTPASAARDRRRSKQRRRMTNVAGLMAALVLTGVGYSAIAPANAADETGSGQSSAEAAGRRCTSAAASAATAATCRACPTAGPP